METQVFMSGWYVSPQQMTVGVETLDSLPPQHVSFTVNKHRLWHKLLIASQIATAANLSFSSWALSLIYSDWRYVCLTSLSSGVYTNSFKMKGEHQRASGSFGSWLGMNVWSIIHDGQVSLNPQNLEFQNKCNWRGLNETVNWASKRACGN